jgi:hypothetical protein
MISINQNQNNYITYGQMNLINDFRTHWEEFAIWIRSFMVSTITGFSNITSISNRLYQIPSSLGSMFEPYFGVKASEQLQQLLLLYIVNAQSLITAEYSKDKQAADAAATALFQSSDDIADFLASINPYWNKSQWEYLFYYLNELIITETVTMLAGEYDKELDIRDRMMKHALVMGDYMASGVMSYLVPKASPAR